MNDKTEINPEIQSILNMLYDIAQLNMSDFSIDDDILKSIKNMMDSVVWTLGSEFDEATSLLIKKCTSSLNELSYKKITIFIEEDFTDIKSIKNLICSFLHIPGVDPIKMNYPELLEYVNQYADNIPIKDSMINIDASTLSNIINYIAERKDDAYMNSKKMMDNINTRIDYNFSHNDYLLKNSCFQAMSATIFLIGYYAECTACFKMVLTHIYNGMQNSLNKSTT